MEALKSEKRRRAITWVLGLTYLATCVWWFWPADSEPPVAAHETAQPTAVERGPEKIVVVLLDALRRDHLSVYAYPRDTSPHIDRLASEGLFLANVVAHSSQTVPATLSVLTSLLPHQHGVQFWSGTMNFSGIEDETGAPVLSSSVTTMAEHFARAGFFTAAVVSNPWLSPEHGFAQGFAEYLEIDCHQPENYYVCDGGQINAEAKRLLREQRQNRTLLYLHYMDVHSPYAANPKVPKRYRPSAGSYVYRNGLMPGLDPADLRYTMALYDERIRYVDELLAELFDFTQREGLDADTTWIITSDHGDEFYEHGGLGHGTTLYNELINSFAVFWNPRRFEPRRVHRYVPAVDVLPTLLDAYGIAPGEELAGRSRLDPAKDRGSAPIVSELADRKALLDGSWKYLVDLDSGREELYEVGPLGDIEARQRRERPDVVERMRRQLQPLAQMPVPSEASPELSPEQQERLRSLGYLQ